jgi:hypothetical protein
MTRDVNSNDQGGSFATRAAVVSARDTVAALTLWTHP